MKHAPETYTSSAMHQRGAYGSVSFMHTEDRDGKKHISFVLSRSHVAPKKQMSIPQLELSAALTGAHIAKFLQTELTIIR